MNSIILCDSQSDLNSTVKSDIVFANNRYAIWISFMEIYNEKIIDLLDEGIDDKNRNCIFLEIVTVIILLKDYVTFLSLQLKMHIKCYSTDRTIFTHLRPYSIVTRAEVIAILMSLF